MKLYILSLFAIVAYVSSETTPKEKFAFNGGSSYPDCGQVASSNRRSASLDKNDATPGQNPYHVNIVFSNFKSKYLKKEPCGGTLISKRAVLTSGNCLFAGSKRLTTNNIQVTLGAYDLSKPLEASRITVSPLLIVPHPEYNHSSLLNFEHNLGLLIFNESDIKISENLAPACLWDDDFDIQKNVDTVGEVVGWGTDSNSTQIDRLQMNHFKVAALSDCRTSFSNAIRPTENFCVSHTNDPEGCAYDDGAGFILTKNGRKYLRGVFMYGLLKDDKKYTAKKDKICVPARRPLVNDLDRYMDWIVDNVPDISRQH